MYRWENDKFSETASGLIFVGGIDSNMWLDNGKQLSRNFKQGYRVYSSEGIACSITSNGGGFGACTGLYLMWNEVRKLNTTVADRVQTLPDNYTFCDGVSEAQVLVMVGRFQ